MGIQINLWNLLLMYIIVFGASLVMSHFGVPFVLQAVFSCFMFFFSKELGLPIAEIIEDDDV